MNISENTSLKELESIKRKIEKRISAKKAQKTDQGELYALIKNDHADHKRQDGRKVFRGVVDYLECYVRGLPPIAKSKFYQRFGIVGNRGKVTDSVISQVKQILSEGNTLAEAAQASGVSTATCQKIKKGDYDK